MCQVSLVSAERLYLFAAWLSHGETIRESPVRPNAIAVPYRGAYKAMIAAVRDGSWARDGADGLMRAARAADCVGRLLDLVAAFGELYESLDVLDAPTCARELEDAYQRERYAARLIAEAEAVMAGADMEGVCE